MATAEDVEATGSFTTKTPQLCLPLSCDPPGPNNPHRQRVWIVFGGTGHMGRSVVKTALSNGDIVTTIGRVQIDDVGAMQKVFSVYTPAGKTAMVPVTERTSTTAYSVDVGEADPASPASTNAPSPLSNERGANPNLLCLLCDVRVRSSVAAAISEHLKRWTGGDGAGRLDIVANCTGYGVFGACEDQDDSELRNQFETNFWGTLHIVQLTLPHLRMHGGGRYLIFSSTSGALGVPGLGPYCATKYAVEGLVESMLYEIESFDIRATLVSPGHVRTDEPEDLEEEQLRKGHEQNDNEAPVKNPSLGHLPVYSSFVIKPPSAPYSNPTSPAFHAKRVVQWMADSQPTSVVKAATLIWQLAHCSYPPLRLLLGNFAVESVRDRLKTIMEEIEDWKFLSFGEHIDTDKARERISGKDPSRGNSEDEDEEEEEQPILQASSIGQRQGSLAEVGSVEEDVSDIEDAEYADLMEE